ncbi:hypothetical protein, partial [Haliangium sp. UPWRP_2]|uniref:hypothetical protein n=1 Tax=Haliangium sp. UPWRP_2 TaxID=1931276 RepID=UPI001E36CC5A
MPSQKNPSLHGLLASHLISGADGSEKQPAKQRISVVVSRMVADLRRRDLAQGLRLTHPCPFCLSTAERLAVFPPLTISYLYHCA